MLGVILCGGQSSRMGSDKGLLKLEAKTWAQTAIDKVNILQLPVKISVNAQQYQHYAEVFSSSDLVVDNPSLSIGGPLLGVMSAHLAYPDEDLFVLACDMPLMEAHLLEELYQHFQLHPGADAYLFTNNGEPEPLCGIYTAKGLSTVPGLIQSGQLRKHSMKFLLDHLTLYGIALEEDQKKYFRNFNAHAELNGL